MWFFILIPTFLWDFFNEKENQTKPDKTQRAKAREALKL
jgi:hypothetical protein